MKTIILSFKYGEFEGERKGRYFTDLTEATEAELVKKVPKLTRISATNLTDWKLLHS